MNKKLSGSELSRAINHAAHVLAQKSYREILTGLEAKAQVMLASGHDRADIAKVMQGAADRREIENIGLVPDLPARPGRELV
jgi:hypothetical protein